MYQARPVSIELRTASEAVAVRIACKLPASTTTIGTRHAAAEPEILSDATAACGTALARLRTSTSKIKVRSPIPDSHRAK